LKRIIWIKRTDKKDLQPAPIIGKKDGRSTDKKPESLHMNSPHRKMVRKKQ
jgi:hypothetical protein